MTDTELNNLKYPIGKYTKPVNLTREKVNNYINDIESFPLRLKIAIEPLSTAQIDTTYRPNGWTIRQVIHHCADSHMNAFIRLKLTLTEEKPVVKPYWEDRWAELADAKTMNIEPSIKLLEGLHVRWAVLLKSLSEKELEKDFIHPEHGKAFQLNEFLGIYAWHCNHHLAHITSLKKTNEWK